MPEFHELDLWFRVESLYNENKPVARLATYEFSYDYRRLRVPGSTYIDKSRQKEY